MNHLKTWILMAGLTALVVVIGGALGGRTGLYIGLGIAVAMNFFSYWFSDKMVIKMTGAQPVSEAEAPDLHMIVESLARRADIPKPRIYIQPDPQPNAFATGRNPAHAVVAVTEGLLRTLDRQELEGVIAHELAHIKNRDILIGSMAAVMAGAISLIVQIAYFFGGSGDRDRGPLGIVIMLFAWIVAPIAAMLIQMAISRSREYMADATGAQIAGRPDGLADALLALERGAELRPMEVSSSAAHMYIMNPLAGGGLSRLFSTHPPTAERVRRLRAAASAAYAA